MTELDRLIADEDREGTRWLADVSFEVAGGAAAAVAGLAGDPVLAVVGGAAGAATPQLLRQVQEWGGRMLGRRERDRVGAVLVLIADELRRRRAEGATLREDWFGDDADPSGDELAEGVLLFAGREFRERKLPHLAALYSRLATHHGMSSERAHYLLTVVERLTWRQMVVMAAMQRGTHRAEAERLKPIRDASPGAVSDGMHAEMHDLAALGLYGYATGTPGYVTRADGTFGREAFDSRHVDDLDLTGYGEEMHAYLDLKRISDEECVAVVEKLYGVSHLL